MLIDLCMDALLDTIKLVPFLFITYLAMEYLEHRTKETSKQMVKKAGRFGPFIGSVVGMVPQCGFSAAASGFYAGGVISVGNAAYLFVRICGTLCNWENFAFEGSYWGNDWFCY